MKIQSITPFLEYFERVRERTVRVIACIPADHIEWTYREGKFTFGDMIRHLATIERYMYAENAQFRLSTYPGHGRELAEGYDGCVQFLHTLHAESMAIFRTLSSDDLRKKCTTPGGIEITLSKWLRAMVEHEVHHRGQLYLYLSLLGITTPPLYGLTEEEVVERSRH